MVCYNEWVTEKNIVIIKKLYTSGFSIAEISLKTSFSKSGIQYILKKEKVIMRTRSDAVRLQHHTRLSSYTSYFPDTIPQNLECLYFVGLSLYWGEGSKTGNTIVITNSDPDIILIFVTFLRKICHIDEKRLHLLIQCHSEQNQADLIRFWSLLTNVPTSQFYKCTVKKSSSKESTKRLEFGTISLRYADSLLFKELLVRVYSLKTLKVLK